MAQPEKSNSAAEYHETDSLTLYAAVCFGCQQSVDDDGGEYRLTPGDAVDHVLRHHGWTRDEDAHLICDECRLELD